MKRPSLLTLFTVCLTIAAGAVAAHAGGPLPDTREDDFAHVCKGGANAGDSCSIPTEETDCPRSRCVVDATTKAIHGTVTVIAHDAVTDWSTGRADAQALTLLLEVRSPDGTKQLLAATYQDLVAPQNPPSAPGNTIVLPMDEVALRDVTPLLSGLLFLQPEAQLAEQLRTIFGTTGTPALILTDKKPQLADHTGDPLATVLRFKVQIQFLVPAA
jgi:hypothetical protein